MYALILAGGSGTRLWPYSRSSRPKQFLNISGTRSMLQETVDRILPMLPPEHVFVATGSSYADLVAEQLPDVPRENILSEPFGRGTAPCIGLAALHIQQRDPHAVMAVLSADHRVEKPELFRSILMAGEQLAEQGYVVTLGITPDAPGTGYGYIKQGEQLESDSTHAGYRIAAFVEKPDIERARSYVSSGEYVWNAGMFVWRTDRILEELQEHRPQLAQSLATIGEAIGTAHEQEVLEAVWPSMENVAIDIAVMEQTRYGVVIPAALGWSDVGDWSALAETLPQDIFGNAVVGHHIGLDTRSTLVYGNGRVVTTIGVEDLLIVDTPDALLICRRDRAQDVKALLASVREQHVSLL
ncbi:MAG TPA: mannose-1-phosphate guanylyltransferase [Roseiflexaceae bacterium]|nr:mannose-1-phosphate guanylyltransferase [Roseiflexaceae bacterium]